MRLARDDQVYGVLCIDAPLEAASILARSSLGLLVASALIVGLGMSVIGYFLARSLAGPVERITQMAESLASGQMNVRVDPQTRIQEMNRLAEAFNNMATRLQVYVDRAAQLCRQRQPRAAHPFDIHQAARRGPTQRRS